MLDERGVTGWADGLHGAGLAPARARQRAEAPRVGAVARTVDMFVNNDAHTASVPGGGPFGDALLKDGLTTMQRLHAARVSLVPTKRLRDLNMNDGSGIRGKA